MDGRLFILLVFLAVPGALVGVTIGWFHANPIAILVLFSTMLVGIFYLLTYRDSFN